jgi:RNA polymerase sigma-70 factor (ECF subfamily)
MQTDEDLLAGVAAGDRAAFAELFQRRNGNVYRFALHMLGQPSLADDVTQEVFLVVMREAGRFDRTRSSGVAWLCGIARNHALRRLAADHRVVAFDEHTGAEPIASTADPVLDLSRAETVEQVRAAVLTLPLAYREAVALCDLQEMTYVDAAAALGCAVGTVRSRLHRGRALLGEKLAGQSGKRWIA